MTRTVLFNCPIKAEIRAVDSHSDLRIFVIVMIIVIIILLLQVYTFSVDIVPNHQRYLDITRRVTRRYFTQFFAVTLDTITFCLIHVRQLTSLARAA